YHNDGNGHFTDVTAGSGLDVSCYGMGVAVGDYDNDGLPDVFITCVAGNHLFRNEGQGKFSEVTDAAGVAGPPNISPSPATAPPMPHGRGEGHTDGWSTSAAWIDYDNDGKLDLFVCNYVRWSPEIERAANFELHKLGRAYGPPRKFQDTFACLYHNEGN